MKILRFMTVGENIHCTRVYLAKGKFVGRDAGGHPVILYAADGRPRQLPIPEAVTRNAEWQAGRVKHAAVAIWQGLYGDAPNRALGIDYLQSLARQQTAAGASFLDVNVDEFSADPEEQKRAMAWTVDIVQRAVKTPISVDSSLVSVLEAGLNACDPSRGRPLVNSVSLERTSSIELARRYGASVIASCAGEADLPSSVEDRLSNLGRLMPRLRSAGLEDARIHVDPLVLPISVDGRNGRNFLDAVSAVRREYGPSIHVVAGLSNVSFGMPSRKLINQVFSWLAVEAGADGGIVDPAQINEQILNAMDPASEGFQLARALLLGDDEFGMSFIAASREGKV